MDRNTSYEIHFQKKAKRDMEELMIKKARNYCDFSK